MNNHIRLHSVLIALCLSLQACQSTPNQPLPEETPTEETPTGETPTGEPLPEEPLTPVVAAPTPEQPEDTSTQTLVQLPDITDSRLSEISGLAVSASENTRLWAINDSGNSPWLFGLNHSGDIEVAFRISEENRDWEALTAFQYNGESLLLLADTGDNLNHHAEYSLHLIIEPQAGTQSMTTIDPLLTISFNYPNGPRNSEAVAVDETNQLILLITKQEGTREVYSLPLSLEPGNTPETATFVGLLSDIPQTSFDILAGGLVGVDFSQVTELEISPEGYAWALTYRGIYQWLKDPGESWATVFEREPVEVLRHSLSQAEAMGLSVHTGNLFFTSERLPAPLYRVRPLP